MSLFVCCKLLTIYNLGAGSAGFYMWPNCILLALLLRASHFALWCKLLGAYSKRTAVGLSCAAFVNAMSVTTFPK